MLKINKASVAFGDKKKKALDALNLVINPGEFVVVLGSNGAGKSTLLNLVSGDVLSDTGNILLAEVDITSWPSFKRARLVAKVQQSPSAATVGELTVAENMAFALLRGQMRGLRFSSSKDQRRLFVEKLAELGMGLENRLDDLVSGLSGGQRQALSLVMAMLSNSKILLLDEHTAALDPKTAATVMAITNRLVRQNNLTTLMITHNMNDALGYGDRTLFLEDGRIAREVSAEERRNLGVADLVNFFRIQNRT